MVADIISFKNASFQYHSQANPTLKNIDVSIKKGEKILVAGASGSGKSTFGNCLNGLIPNIHKGNLSGEILVNGKDIKEADLFDMSFHVSTVLQDTDGQFIGLTVGEDIAFSLENDNVETKEMHKKVTKWLNEVDLVGFESHKPQDLSGGQKQRVSMAGVLVDESPILLFDEPLANLDPHAGLEAMKLIEDIHQKTECTIIIIEHRLEDVLCIDIDRVLLFDDGQIVADLTPDKLLRSNLLQAYGIREPLYLTSMKYAGVPLSEVEQLDKIESLDVNVVRPYISRWITETKESTERESKKSLLTIENLSFSYSQYDKPVLDNIELKINQGEMISLVGKNGSGKSTLAKAICGFVEASGDLMWKEEKFSSYSIKERADKIGYVMQNPNQMISKKMIREEVALGLELRGVSQEIITDKIDDVLKICGLYPYRNWPISALSYGQKKRVTIASILVLEPDVIILDEPTAGQDYKHYTEIMTFLETINQSGITVIMITHDMHLMLEYTDRCLVLGEGVIQVDTTPSELLTNESLIQSSSLKETSLFTFGKHLNLENPESFVRKFTAYEREVRFK